MQLKRMYILLLLGRIFYKCQFVDGISQGFPVTQMVKNLPAMQETHVLFLDGEDPLEKEWQPTPVFLPRKLHGQRSLAGYSPWGLKESDTAEVT